MKSIVLAAAIFLAAAPATTTLTQEERKKAVAELEGSKKMFLDATKGLSVELQAVARALVGGGMCESYRAYRRV